MKLKTWSLAIIAIAAVSVGGYIYWQQQLADQLPDGIVSSNGRTEADQINIATKFAGRIEEITVDEGDMVDAGQVIARMDTSELETQIRRAEAQIRRMQNAKTEASASILRARSQFEFAEAELKRVQSVHSKGYATTEDLDKRFNALQAADASYRASVAGAEQAEETIISAREDLSRLNTILQDAELKAPRHARVQYRLAEPGEILPVGGSVVTLLDIADVYMTIFLPTSDAGKLELGSDARIVLDPIPEYVIPSKVSFVAAQAQFTPKAVETTEERAKLMFRVKLKIDPEILRKYEDRVKTGVRGIAYLRLPHASQWPENLEIKLPE